MRFISEIREKLKKKYARDPLFWEYEIQANKIVAVIIAFCLIVLVIMGIFDFSRVIKFDRESAMVNFSMESILWLLIPLVLCIVFKGERRWLKVVMMLGLSVASARLYSIIGFQLLLFMVIPTVLSCVYYSKKLTIVVAIETGITFAGATMLNVYYGHIDYNAIGSDRDLGGYNTVREFVSNNFEKDELYKNTMMYNYIPNLLMFVVIAVICVWIAKRCHKMVLDKVIETEKNASIQSELNIATDIQKDMLPTTFPPFPDREEFDIYAVMKPAKEVGGDFYDFFMIDDDKIAIVIGDVSGKGVPAALFMVIAKTLIKNSAMINPSPGEIFAEVNNALCENNEAALFVTAWMAIVDLKSGEMKYVNAGHNPPLIKHQNNKFDYIDAAKSFVLAGIDDIIFKEQTLKLNEGDELLLYTDGVTEAYDGKELYGTKRLESLINSTEIASCTEGIQIVERDIDSFSAGMEQADDITMLWFEYKKRVKDMNESKVFEAKIENLKEANAFLNEKLDALNVTSKERMQLELAFEELFTNVSNYSYGDQVGRIEVGISYAHDECLLTIKVTDSGEPFNPLDTEEPDLTLNADDRPIGGLGIFMIKKNVDKVTYDYINGENVVTLYKKIGE